MRYSTQIHREPIESLGETIAFVFKDEELRGFVPDKLLEPMPGPRDPTAGTVIGVKTLFEWPEFDG